VQCKADGLVSSVSQYTKPPNQTKTYKEQRKSRAQIRHRVS